MRRAQAGNGRIGGSVRVTASAATRPPINRGARMRTLLPLLGLATVVAITLGGPTSIASAAPAGPNGKLVFQTNRDGGNNDEIYTTNADGTNRVNLTRNPARDLTPRWSSDGRQIVFVSNRDGNFEIFAMDDVGGNVRQLTSTSGVENRWPSWTGDGRILFHRGTFPNRDVLVMNADGTGETNLTPDSVDSAWAAAAPKGPSIVLSRFDSSPGEGQRLYTTNTVTRVMKLVIPAPPEVSDVQANWSPRGNDLVFVRFDATESDLYVVQKNGHGLRQLTNTPGRLEYQPAFSPDGRKIVFHACVDPGGPGQHCANYTRNVDGSDEAEITVLPQAPYLDTFTGDRIDSFWQPPNINGSGPTIGQANGQLEVTFPTGTTYEDGRWADVGLFMNCRLHGDFDVQVDYRLLTGPLPDFMNVGFFASEFKDGNYIGANGMFVFNGFGFPGVSTYFPTFPGLPNVYAGDASLSGSLRVERKTEAGVTTLTASRLSAGTWVPMLTSTPYTYPIDESAANFNVFWNGSRPFGAEAKVGYDNFAINSGKVVCPSWWDDSAPDWQPTRK